MQTQLVIACKKEGGQCGFAPVTATRALLPSPQSTACTSMPVLPTSDGSWSTPKGPLREPLLDAGASPPPRQELTTVEVITRSFAWMEYRKMRRLLFGLYPEKQRIIVFWCVAYFLVLGVLAGLDASGWQPPGLRLHWDPNDVLLYTLFTCITLFAVTKTGTDHAQIRFCLYWAYVAVMVLLVTDNLHVVQLQPQGAPSSHELRRRLLVGLLVLEALTLQTWWCLQNLLPSAVLWTISRVDLRLWWRIDPVEAAWPGGAAATEAAAAGGAGEASRGGVGAWEGGDDFGCRRFRYARRASGLRVGRGLTCVPPCGGTVHVCSYRGGLHPATGRPHGYGEWVDDSYHGECLRGFWEDGVPIGPFCSREFGSGFAFVSTQLGYCCSHDDPTVAGTPWVRRRAPPLRRRVGRVLSERPVLPRVPPRADARRSQRRSDRGRGGQRSGRAWLPGQDAPRLRRRGGPACLVVCSTGGGDDGGGGGDRDDDRWRDGGSALHPRL